jgi:hypothetical protein
MKNYIANGRCGNPRWFSMLICECLEFGPWDTSKALIRRTLERCIHIGRQHRAQGRKEDEYEAYRLLGQAVGTITSASWHVGANECILSSYIPSKTSRRTRIFASSPLFRWVTPMYMCMSATMCASSPLTVDGSPLWSLEHSDPVTSCTAC